MSPFTWNLFGRIAYAPHDRHDMQEYNGWWRHSNGDNPVTCSTQYLSRFSH